MVQQNKTARKTAFTVSIEAAQGVSTGISAQDRAHTIRVAADPKSMAKDIVAPGHIFPLRAVPGGVLERAGHTEGSIELCRLAGLVPAAVICEIINEDGTMARKPDLEKFSKTHSIPMVTIEELIVYRTIAEDWMIPSREARFPNRFSNGVHAGSATKWTIQAYRNAITHDEHIAISTQPLSQSASGVPLVRIHSECLTGDTLGSLRCDCGQQLQTAIEKISDDPDGGAVVYLKNQEGRGIGLWNKIEAYALQDQGKDTFEANHELGFHDDLRQYHEAAKILMTMGMTQVRLITSNPQKVKAMESFGIQVVERVDLQSVVHPENEKYLQSKHQHFQHSQNL